jgi:molybdopterin-guanine dinucleotide biosynthesis protein A
VGGVLTALKTSRADGELFLACDMPFVSASLLRKLLRSVSGSRQAAFTRVNGLAGFPFVLRVKCVPIVEAQIAAKEFSLQALARALRAALVAPPRSGTAETFNVNTAADLAAARTKAVRAPAR